MKKRSGRPPTGAGTDVDQRMAQALGLHRQGNLTLAEVVYRDILRTVPRDARALGMLGLIEAHKGNPAVAIQLLKQSTDLSPNSVATHFNLGLLYQQEGRNEEALASFERALQLKPDSAQAQNSRGMILKNLGRYEEALASYEEALRLMPDYFDALNNRGVALRYLNRHDQAAASFAHALQLRTDAPEVHNNLGYAFHKLGRYEDAFASYARALALKPDNQDALNNRGITLHELDRFEEAIACFQRAIELDPGSAEAIMNMGVSLYELKRYDEARACQLRALDLRPDYVDAQINLGNVLLELNRHEDALVSYQKGITSRPGDQDVLMNMGNAMRDLHRFQEALSYYERALALDESCADVRWNQALCRLAMGDFERGWEGFEWRRKMPSVSDTSRQFDAPQWLGTDSLANKTILVHAEQGLGDTIQFCRFAPLLAELGARVILEVQRPLARLIRCLEGAGQIIVPGEPAPAHDYQCPLLSLPFALRTRLDTIPARVPYLQADSALVNVWRDVIVGGQGLNIGLAWSGNAAYKNDHRRSVPLGRLLAALPSGVTYWSLQKEVGAADQTLLDHAGNVHRFDLNDFEHTAAQISLLDAVISVDTSIAHLAGALGKPLWILLAYSADWRWMWPQATSPWYPSATLCRQAAPGDWESALALVAAKITS